MTFFINPQGKIVASASGYRKWESKEGLMMFEQLLSEATQTNEENTCGGSNIFDPDRKLIEKSSVAVLFCIDLALKMTA